MSSLVDDFCLLEANSYQETQDIQSEYERFNHYFFLVRIEEWFQGSEDGNMFETVTIFPTEDR